MSYSLRELLISEKVGRRDQEVTDWRKGKEEPSPKDINNNVDRQEFDNDLFHRSPNEIASPVYKSLTEISRNKDNRITCLYLSSSKVLKTNNNNNNNPFLRFSFANKRTRD